MKNANLGDYLLWEGKPAKVIGETDQRQVIIELLKDKKCPHCGEGLGKAQMHVIVNSPMFQNCAEQIRTIQSVINWVMVTDKLPELEKDVMIVYKDGHATAVYGLNQDPEGREKRMGILRINKILLREDSFDPYQCVTLLQALNIWKPILTSYY